jgi:hypothetical protein
MPRGRKTELVPDGTPATITLANPQVIQSNYGNRQVQAVAKVEDGDAKGSQFKIWLSVYRDKETKEDYISQNSDLYRFFELVNDADELYETVFERNELDDNDEFSKFLAINAAKLSGLKLDAIVKVRTPDNGGRQKNVIDTQNMSVVSKNGRGKK